MELIERYDVATKHTEYRLLISDLEMQKFTSTRLMEWYLGRFTRASTIPGKLLALTAIASGIYEVMNEN